MYSIKFCKKKKRPEQYLEQFDAIVIKCIDLFQAPEGNFKKVCS